MNEISVSFDNEPLEKLVESHARLKRELGPNHFLVESLWAEIRRRKSLQDDGVAVAVPERG